MGSAALRMSAGAGLRVRHLAPYLGTPVEDSLRSVVVLAWSGQPQPVASVTFCDEPEP